MAKAFLATGAAFGFLGVCLGAFGAHALKDQLDTYALDIYQTAVNYQMYHALALLAVGVLALKKQSRLLNVAGYLFAFGILIFSGSLYALAISGIKKLGMITPIGGFSFIVGWACLFIFALKKSTAAKP